MNSVEFIEWLKSQMEKTGKTEGKVAKAMGVSRQAVNGHLLGKNAPTFETAARYCRIFGYTLKPQKDDN
jgi:DNA-binding XRE family transcriptional regulator